MHFFQVFLLLFSTRLNIIIQFFENTKLALEKAGCQSIIAAMIIVFTSKMDYNSSMQVYHF